MNPHLAAGQEVTYVGHDGKNHKAKINTCYNDNSARIDWDGGGAVAEYSQEKEPGTFHFEQASPEVEER
jgi:hypothetical protein